MTISAKLRRGRRQGLWGSLAFVAAIAAACSGPTTTQASGVSMASGLANGETSLAGTPIQPLTSQPITLKVVTYKGWPKGDMKFADAFTQQHPNIKIQFEDVAGEARDAYAVRLGADHDSTIDVIAVDVPEVANYSLRGYVAPLDQYFTAADEAAWTPVEQRASKFRDRLMAPPISTSSSYLVLNLDLFRQAGITPPTGLRNGNAIDAVVGDRWTWEKVESTALQIHAKTGKIGMQIVASNDPYGMQPLADSLGGSPISPDGLTATGYIDSLAWLKAATWFQGIFKDGASDPSLENWNDQPFLSGSVAMAALGDYDLSACAAAKFECDVAAFPYFAGGKVATPTGAWHVGVAAYSTHKAEAAAFLRFWSSKEGELEYTKSLKPRDDLGSYQGYQDVDPAVTSLVDALQTDPSTAAWPRIALRLSAYEAAHTAVPRASTPGWDEYVTTMITMWKDIQTGTDPGTALRNAAQEIDRQLAKYR
jgi:ABC-type glycerol-3-phosphate transport system substrate-binding protein